MSFVIMRMKRSLLGRECLGVHGGRNMEASSLTDPLA